MPEPQRRRVDVEAFEQEPARRGRLGPHDHAADHTTRSAVVDAVGHATVGHATVGRATVGHNRVLGHDHGRHRVDEQIRPRWRQCLPSSASAPPAGRCGRRPPRRRGSGRGRARRRHSGVLAGVEVRHHGLPSLESGRWPAPVLPGGAPGRSPARRPTHCRPCDASVATVCASANARCLCGGCAPVPRVRCMVRLRAGRAASPERSGCGSVRCWGEYGEPPTGPLGRTGRKGCPWRAGQASAVWR